MSHIFLAVFFRVTHDGLSEKGTTRSLHKQGTILSINLSINQLIYQSINQSISQSINLSVSQSIYQAINQSLNPSVHQSIDKSMNKAIDQSTSLRERIISSFAVQTGSFSQNTSSYCFSSFPSVSVLFIELEHLTWFYLLAPAIIYHGNKL